MRIFNKLKINRCIKLLSKGQYILAAVLPIDKTSSDCATILTMENNHLAESFDKVMSENKGIREFVLHRAANYLMRHEIDCKEFINKLNQ